MSSPAWAQGRALSADDLDALPDEQSVVGRARPEYDPQGLPFGGFRLFPVVNATLSYDDNVFRTESGEEGDFFFGIQPQVSLRSQWSRHYLALRASATHLAYSDLSSETRTSWLLAGTGRLDVTTGTVIGVNLQHNSIFEPRTSRDQINAAEPTPYDREVAGLVFSYDPYSFGFRVAAGIERFDFSATKLIPTAGGGLMSNDDRNRDVYTINATALYEFSPGYAAFVRPAYEKRVYDIDTGRAAGRDSEGYRVDAGLNLLVGRLVRGEVYAGYIRQDLEGPAFSDLSGVDYGAALSWFPTELMTVRLNVSRTPNATTIAGASLSDDRAFAIGIDYEVLRNVILQADLSYIDTKFEGTTRHDEDFGAQIGVDYLLNPYLSANFDFIHTSRDSNEGGRKFEDNTVTVGVSFHL